MTSPRSRARSSVAFMICVATPACPAEALPDRRLVYTWAWESTPERVSRVTVEFRGAGDSTELTLTHDRFFDTAARDRHAHGWQGCLDHFTRYVAR